MAEKILILTIGLASVTIINGLMHTLMYFKLQKYNPGLITGFLFFIPFGVLLLSRIYMEEMSDLKSWMMGFVLGLLGTALIPLTIKWSNR